MQLNKKRADKSQEKTATYCVGLIRLNMKTPFLYPSLLFKEETKNYKSFLSTYLMSLSPGGPDNRQPR